MQTLRSFLEFVWLYFKGFRPVEFVRGRDRVSLHASGWRANGTGRMKRAKDAVAYLDRCETEQWRQIYCGMTPFLVSDRGNIRHIDGSDVPMTLANGRYQIMYKPADSRGRGKSGTLHKKRVYRSMLVAMAWLGFSKGDTEHEIHHVNGYRTDDRLCNLMVVSHEEHMRIHQLGACGLTGLPDDVLALAPAKPAKADTPPSPAEPAPAKPQPSQEKKGTSTPAAEQPQRRTKQAKDGAGKPSEAKEKSKPAQGKNRTRTTPSPAESPKQSKPAAKPGEPNASELRAKLDRAVSAYLKASEHLTEQKELSKAARPVYKALKPFLTLPDAVASFDAALGALRTIAQHHQDNPSAMPATTHSMAGTLHQLMKDSTKRLAAAADEVELACLDELLDEEARRPLFRKTPHAKKFRQCLSIVRSRNEKKSVSPESAGMN